MFELYQARALLSVSVMTRQEFLDQLERERAELEAKAAYDEAYCAGLSEYDHVIDAIKNNLSLYEIMAACNYVGISYRGPSI